MRIPNLAEKINCGWSEWNIGLCSKSCDGGTLKKTRIKNVVESNGGKCSGKSEIPEPCNTQSCPGNLLIFFSFRSNQIYIILQLKFPTLTIWRVFKMSV